jgi:gluconolactonase
MRFSLPTIALLMLLTSVATADEKPEAKDKPKKETKVKTVKVEVKGGLVINVPETWKKEKPASTLRLAQFVIPQAEGDKEAGELALFNFGFGGGVKANIDRWIKQFHADDRKTKVTRGELKAGKYYFVELSGTFNKSIGPPIQRRTEPREGYRMLGVILGIEEKGVYFFKMTGPDKTVAKEGTTLRASFGADGEKEEDVELEELK